LKLHPRGAGKNGLCTLTLFEIFLKIEAAVCSGSL